MVQDHSIIGPDVVRFLKHLMQHVRGKLLVCWDGAPIRRSKVVKVILASGATERIHLEQLPGYAPELNPDEGSWSYLKRAELKNVACRVLARLRDELGKAVGRLRHRPTVILSYIPRTGLVSC